MKREKKKMRKAGRIVLGIFGTLLGGIVLVALVGAVLTQFGVRANLELARSFEPVRYDGQLVPERDADGNWCFKTDRELKVLQLTDIHIGGGWLSTRKDSMALSCVASMVTAEKPDLVVVTGDVAYPMPFQSGTFNNRPPAKIFANLMETLGVYWIPVFGNHDTESFSFHNRDEIGDFYESGEFEHCLFRKGSEELAGCGNSVITVRNGDGIATQSLFFIDSHSYTDHDYLGMLWKYDNIHQDQVDWYRDTLTGLVERNIDLISRLYRAEPAAEREALEKYGKGNSLLFFHIPLREYRDAWREYVENGDRDTQDVRYFYGTAGEAGKVVFCGVHDDELFETVQAMGGNSGIFVGHDHYNNFSLAYKGVRLTYGYSVDYLAYAGIYKVGSQRGCTLITVRPDGTFDCEASNYYQDKYEYLGKGAKEVVAMQDLDKARGAWSLA